MDNSKLAWRAQLESYLDLALCSWGTWLDVLLVGTVTRWGGVECEESGLQD